MKTTFACPGCGQGGSADAAFAGREVRCKHCGQRFALPRPDSDEPDGYALDRPPARSDPPEPAAMAVDRPVFVPSRGDEPTVATSPRPPRRTSSRQGRRDRPGLAWGTWLIRGSMAGAVVLALVGLIAPGGGAIVGWSLLGLGSLLVLIGYAAGAVGAFSEDSLYGILYLAIPLYTAYYIVTRWDDLARWFACSTVGVGLVTFGTMVLRWSGVTE